MRRTPLSVLQKKLLVKGLQAFYRTPLDIGCGSADPGCFGLKESRELDPETMRPKPITDHRERATHRAAAGLSITRLVNRGLVEGSSRGKWRLTPKGVRVAKALWPEILPLSKREVSRRIAGTLDMRAAVHSVVPPRRPRASKTRQPAKESGIEIPMDF
jgi:hypothetical protein